MIYYRKRDIVFGFAVEMLIVALLAMALACMVKTIGA